tara:strand:- start:89 stop:241 length:153 start_codon:yes stop_codon:yes gene_type:complete
MSYNTNLAAVARDRRVINSFKVANSPKSILNSDRICPKIDMPPPCPKRKF